jgi:hypothetical protein
MNVPIPPVFLFETALAQYEVVDGQQRLSTLRQFFDNEFALTGLEKWSDLNGRRYNKLPSRIQAGLQRRSLAAIILLAESGRSDVADPAAAQRDLKRIVFDRLNTGGVRLNAQEIRNAAFDSPFNDLLHSLSRDDLFATIWGIPLRTADEETRPSADLAKNILFKTMRDCEIVLRFFAFRDEASMSSSVKKTLDQAMTRGAQASRPEIEPMRADYLDCLRTAYDLYADRTFRLPNGTLSRALYDAIMVALDRLMRHLAPNDRLDLRRRLNEANHNIQRSQQRLFREVGSQELLVGRLNTRQSIIDRIHLMEELFRSYS